MKEHPEVKLQAARLDRIKDLVCNKLIPGDPADPTTEIRRQALEVTVTVLSPLNDRAHSVRQAVSAAREAQEHASRLMHEAVNAFRASGLSYRDIGYLLGVSYQRAQQIAHQ